MTTHALMELAERFDALSKQWFARKDGYCKDEDFASAGVLGLALMEFNSLRDQLRTAASGVGRITPEQEAADWANDDGGSIIDPREGTPSPPGAEARDAVTLADINAAFNNEIDRVSTLEFNSNEICRAFYRNLLKRINPDWDPAMQDAALRARDD